MPITSLPYLDDQKVLKKKTAYYGQVQGQMVVTGIDRTCFVVHTDDETFVQAIDYDEIFCKRMLSNLDYFFTHHLGPAMVSSEPPPKTKKV